MVGNHAYNLLYKEVMILRNEKKLYETKLQNIKLNELPYLKENICKFKHVIQNLGKINENLYNNNKKLEFKLLLNQINITKIQYVTNLQKKIISKVNTPILKLKSTSKPIHIHIPKTTKPIKTPSIFIHTELPLFETTTNTIKTPNTPILSNDNDTNIDVNIDIST